MLKIDVVDLYFDEFTHKVTFLSGILKMIYQFN